MEAADRLIAKTAVRQHSLVTHHQLEAVGLTRRQVEHRVATKRLLVVHRGVYGLAGVPFTFERNVMAACLATNGVASHRSAAALFKLRGFDGHKAVEITVEGRRAPRLEGVVPHSTTCLERTTIGVIPVTMPARILLDLAACDPVRAERAVNDALFRKLVSLPNLVRFLERAGGRGRPGSARLRELLVPFLAGQAPTESTLEDDLVDLLRRHGLPVPVRQHRLGEHRLDCAYPWARLDLEADGGRWHDPLEDAERDAECRARGWDVERFTYDDIHHRPAEVAARVAYRLAIKGAA